MTLIGNLFRKLRTTNDVVKAASEKSCFRGPFEKQHGKRAETL